MKPQVDLFFGVKIHECSKNIKRTNIFMLLKKLLIKFRYYQKATKI